jgi:hypothetical protein
MIMIIGTTAGIIITIITVRGRLLFRWDLDITLILITHIILFIIVRGIHGIIHIIQLFIIKTQQFIIDLLTGIIYLPIITGIITITICLCNVAIVIYTTTVIPIQTEQEI